MKKVLLILISIAAMEHAKSQVYGCTDPKANNYNAAATINNGSCTYNGANLSPLTSKNLATALTETSGLILWNNTIWSHNDDTDIKLYSVDTATAATLGTDTLKNTVNHDWEEISQDTNYIYVGDCGNNANGNRTDLHILRVSKSLLLLHAPVIDTIWFSYSNQTNFNPAGSNNTDFDCEAFLVSSDSIYLFTKQWVSEKTSIYAMPKTPGTHVASYRSTINVQGLVTGITYLESKRLAVICGYSKVLQPFFYLLYDFTNNDFANGNKRKIDVNLPFHQTEGIATGNGLKYYVSNENGAGNGQKLHTFDLSNFLSGYLKNVITGISFKANKYDISIFPNPATDRLTIKAGHELMRTNGTITDALGRKMLSLQLNDPMTDIDLRSFAPGMYILHVEGSDGSYTFIRK
jgi:hypothetical protein